MRPLVPSDVAVNDSPASEPLVISRLFPLTCMYCQVFPPSVLTAPVVTLPLASKFTCTW